MNGAGPDHVETRHNVRLPGIGEAGDEASLQNALPSRAYHAQWTDESFRISTIRWLT